MKKILLCVLLFIFICFSCRKGGRRCRGEVTVLLNEDAWKAPAVRMGPDIPFDNYFFVGFGTLDDFGDVEQSLTFFKIPYKAGKYYLHRTNPLVDDSLSGVSLRQFLEGDQFIGAWDLEEEPDSSNYIHITHYDERTDEVKGTFNCTLVGGTLFSTEFDTLHFTNGRFEGRICDND